MSLVETAVLKNNRTMDSLHQIRDIIESKAEHFTDEEYLALMNGLMEVSKSFSAQPSAEEKAAEEELFMPNIEEEHNGMPGISDYLEICQHDDSYEMGYLTVSFFEELIDVNEPIIRDSLDSFPFIEHILYEINAEYARAPPRVRFGFLYCTYAYLFSRCSHYLQNNDEITPYLIHSMESTLAQYEQNSDMRAPLSIITTWFIWFKSIKGLY